MSERALARRERVGRCARRAGLQKDESMTPSRQAMDHATEKHSLTMVVSSADMVVGWGAVFCCLSGDERRRVWRRVATNCPTAPMRSFGGQSSTSAT